MQENQGQPGQILFLFTALNALVSISDVQQVISIAAGLIAIVCGTITSIYYHKKTKNIKNEKD